MSTHPTLLSSSLAFGLFASGAAHASDVTTSIGVPGDPGWQAACAQFGCPRPLPTGASQLPRCAPGSSNCLHRVMIDRAEFPEAVCNDGTPGAFYVRAGTGNDVNRWVIHLQGGASCKDYESCLQRYCGVQGSVPYTVNKMSTDWNADGVPDIADHVRASGMASNEPQNRFASWTHVWAYYCSSDNWQGRANDVAFTLGAKSFALDTRGHSLLEAIRSMLRKENPNASWTPAGQSRPIADLDHATEIVFTGTSAGAQGAIANADWFLSEFPKADRSLVLDANFDASDRALLDRDVWVDFNSDNQGEQDFYSARITLDGWAAGSYMDRIHAFTDHTCRMQYEPLQRMDRCSQFSTMLLLNIGGVPIIKTPTFVRLDLADGVIGQQYTDHPNIADYSLLMGGQNGTLAVLDDFTRLMRASLIQTYDDHGSVSGVFAPRCGRHIGLEDSRTFLSTSTPDTDVTVNPPIEVPGTATTFHDALWTWLNVGGGGQRVDIRRLDTDQSTKFSQCQ